MPVSPVNDEEVSRLTSAVAKDSQSRLYIFIYLFYHSRPVNLAIPVSTDYSANYSSAIIPCTVGLLR